MKTLIANLSDRGVIVAAFAAVLVVSASAFAVCAVFKVPASPDVMNNLKDMAIAAGSALSAILVPRGKQADDLPQAPTTQPQPNQASQPN